MYSYVTINQQEEKKTKVSSVMAVIHPVCEVPFWPHQGTEIQVRDSNNPESLLKFLVTNFA